MKRFIAKLKLLFFPPEGASPTARVLPFIILGILTLTVFLVAGAGWEYTNTAKFCGTSCHTMPPEYTSYLVSPHARVACVECHLGRGYIAENFGRKAGDISHITAMLFKNYEVPITAHKMRPARETCERCHFPEKFSDDSLREIRHYADDQYNTLEITYLILKTGGGSDRQGLGKGIHWHVENSVLFLSSNESDQEIPYVRVVQKDGTVDEYLDIESELISADIDPADLEEMSCITCHNRISHLIYPPEIILDQLLDTGVISTSLPDIRRKAVELFYRPYESYEIANNAFVGLGNYYQVYYPEIFNSDRALIDQAIVALQTAYTNSVSIEQKSDWNAHPNDIGHQFSPGCFRCHDGKHLNASEESIRLECNLCHSIPVVATDDDLVTNLEISRGLEPETHFSSNWIGIHRHVFDYTCENCHTTEDPGGVSNTSFCSNSACHGRIFNYAGFDAPGLREIWLSQLPPPPPPMPKPNRGALTYDQSIGALLTFRCGSCHGNKGIEGLNLTTYETVLVGGKGGSAIIPGDPDNSMLIQKQSGGRPHFVQFSQEELAFIIEWVLNGAPETNE
ncbi:MAG: NapC/NirT family cytochrome c [Chloroflexi bacterium]|nr:NapC/NirT family cytochrome c [Chloroflexota bacterium]